MIFKSIVKIGFIETYLVYNTKTFLYHVSPGFPIALKLPSNTQVRSVKPVFEIGRVVNVRFGDKEVNPILCPSLLDLHFVTF